MRINKMCMCFWNMRMGVTETGERPKERKKDWDE